MFPPTVSSLSSFRLHKLSVMLLKSLIRLSLMSSKSSAGHAVGAGQEGGGGLVEKSRVGKRSTSFTLAQVLGQAS